MQAVGSAGSGDGSIVDGVSSSIKATVFDYATSNPLAATLVDTNGDPISVGGGTQYTEDAAAAANPVGTAVNLIRQDTPSALVTTDGDNVTQRGTNYGAAYAQIVTSAGAFVDTFGAGTQYTEGDTDASVTGTAMLMEGAADTLLPIQGTVADGLLVNLGANNDVAVSSVTGVVSASNSSTATLLSGAVFTGTGTSILGYASISVIAKSNVASATDGLSLQFSSDNTNWDVAYGHTLPAGAGRTFKLGIEGQYFRVVYTNGGTGQTYFRLQTILTPTATKHFGMPVGEVIVDGDNAQLTKSVITGVTTAGGGAYVDVKVSPSGAVQIGGTIDEITTLPLPTGASTSANQTTIIGHVDGIEGLLTTIDADTGTLAAVDFATGTDVASLAVVGGGVEAAALRVTIANDSTGVVSVDDNGGSITVDGAVTVSATDLDIRDIAAATDSIAVHGDVGILDQLDLTSSNPAVVAIVDGNGDQITSFGGGTQYTEDAAAAADPVGTMGMAVRADALAAVTTTDGDNIAQRATNKGELYVKHVDSIPVTATDLDIRDLTSVSDSVSAVVTSSALPTGASTAANQTTIIGHLDGVEGLLTTIDADTGALAAIDYATGADVASLAVVGGGVEATALRVTLASDSTGLLSVDDNGGSLTVDYATTGSGTATGALRVELPTNGTGVIATVGAVTAITNALPAGTNAIGKLAANSGVDIGDVDITSIAAGTNDIGRVGHNITGIGHGVTTVTTAGTDVALAGSTACKSVIITAQTDNTNIIAVGATGVDATVATGTGVPLSPGDSVSIDIDNLADIFIDSLVNGEGVRYTYFT